MRCNPDHHTVNFIRGDNIELHHIAFELKDMSHMQNACEMFATKNIRIMWGPVRHGPGHNIATYHRNPDQQNVEVYIDLDQMKDEELGYFDPKPWHRDTPQRPKTWARNETTIWGLPTLPEYRRGSNVPELGKQEPVIREDATTRWRWGRCHNAPPCGEGQERGGGKVQA